jgi:alpha-tubulin suppressor-like RCC1 family protein
MHKLTVAQLFGSVPVQVGQYRLRVVRGSARVQLRFSVVAASLSRLSAGDNHTCRVSAAGAVSCWGNNDDGELGDGTTINRRLPVVASGITAAAVSAASRHTCALLAAGVSSTAGSVTCWGWNGVGQLGNGTKTSSPTPVPVAGITDATAVSAGGAFFTSYTCALLGNRSVSCWGGNHDGELGNGSKADSSIPVRVKGISTAVQISAGLRHSCALLTSGAVRCWGWGVFDQLGNGTKHSSSAPVRVKGISAAIQVSAGGSHSCALLSSGAIKCWGSNDRGQLGIGKIKPFQSGAPLAVKIPAPAIAVSAGWDNTCALLATGTTYCWGSNDSGQLGVGKTYLRLAQSTRPLRVKGLAKASALSVGSEDACAFLRTAAIKCWGSNYSGQLGNGMAGLESTPVVAKGITSATAVDSTNTFSCAVLKDGKVSCWGQNTGGQLGVSSKVEVRSTPALVPGVKDAIAVTGGLDHACALISGGTVSCWGVNGSGQLGNGTKVSSIAPVKVSGIATAVQIGAGEDFTCAIVSGGKVKCWGTNYASQLGDGSGTRQTRPVSVIGITGAVALSVVGNSSCVVLTDGAVECWGGYDPTDPMANTGNPLPTDVGMANALEASIGSECALISGGTITCWGDPNNPDSGIHQISGVANAVRLDSACALASGGSVYCWGRDESGQLGNGTVSYVASPNSAVSVSGIADATAIGASYYNACAVLAGGTVKCWGSDDWGQLGNGEKGFSSVPVSVVGLP